jgi:response regulator of citrate/malate metabolism
VCTLVVKKNLTVQQVAELRDRRDQGALIKTLMKDYGLSKASVYRYLSSTATT